MAFTHEVVGVDQSLTGTGLSLIKKDGTHQTTLIKPTMRGIARLMYIEEVVNRWIPNTAELVAMEGYAMGAKGQDFMLGECGGTIKRVAWLRKIPLISVAPGTLKKYVSGKGNAKKNLMLLATYKKFGVEFEDDNESDAYGLGRMAIDYLDASVGNMPAGFEEAYKAIVKYNAALEGGEIDE